MSTANSVQLPDLPKCKKFCIHVLKKKREACQKEKEACEQRRLDLLHNYQNSVSVAIEEQNSPPVELTEMTTAPAQEPQKKNNTMLYYIVGGAIIAATIFFIWKSKK